MQFAESLSNFKLATPGQGKNTSQVLEAVNHKMLQSQEVKDSDAVVLIGLIESSVQD